MLHEEIILRQKRAETERLAERRRLLKEAGLASFSVLRRRLAFVLLEVAKKLEPELARQRSVNLPPLSPLGRHPL